MWVIKNLAWFDLYTSCHYGFLFNWVKRISSFLLKKKLSEIKMLTLNRIIYIFSYLINFKDLIT
jgi:hypothetical protein